jgi:hypothetical protein
MQMTVTLSEPQEQRDSASKTPIPNTEGSKLAHEFWTKGQRRKDRNSYLPQNRASSIKITKIEISTKKQMSVLGVIFDSKLEWSLKVEKSVKNQDVHCRV